MKLKKINQLVQAALITAVASSAVYADSKPTIEFGGVIEASISKVDGEDSQSAVDTVELGITAQINDSISGEIVLLQEDINTDDQTDFEVDTALIHMETAAGTVSVGKFTVPFTTGETNMIEDSTTLVEPAGVGLSLSGSIDMLEYSVYALDPAAEDTADITGNTYDDESATAFGDLAGINVNVAFNDNIAFNGSYAKIDDKTGTSGALIGSMDNFGIILEATKIEDEDKARTNIEVSYDIGFGVIAASVQKGIDEDENENLINVDYRSVGFSTDVYENTNLNIQFLEADDGDDTEKTVAAMLAFEF